MKLFKTFKKSSIRNKNLRGKNLWEKIKIFIKNELIYYLYFFIFSVLILYSKKKKKKN